MSTADSRIKTISASCSHNTSDTSSRKECKQYSTNKPLHDEVDDAIISHQKSMSLVQSHLGQEEEQTMVDTLSTSAPVPKTIGTSCSRNTSNTSSRRKFKKDGSDKSVHDEVDDSIASHQKSMLLVKSNIGQEEGRRMANTLSIEYTRLKTIGALHSRNTSDTFSRKGCENDGAYKPVHDEGDDAITSQHKDMFLVHSNIGPKEGQTKIADNISKSVQAQVTYNTTEYTADPPQVTTHTPNSMDTDTKHNYKD